MFEDQDDQDDEIDHVIDAMSEQVAHNTTRLDQLLSRLQNRLAKDYTHIPLAIGTLMVLFSFFHVFFSHAFAFSLTTLIWGSIIISLTLYFRHRVASHLTHLGDSLTRLDQDRQKHARQLTVIKTVIQEGIPDHMTISHLLVLLGEYHKTENNGSDHDNRPEHN